MLQRCFSCSDAAARVPLSRRGKISTRASCSECLHRVKRLVRDFSRVQLFVCGLPSLRRALEKSITRGASINIPCAICISLLQRPGRAHVEREACRSPSCQNAGARHEAASWSVTDRGRPRRWLPEPCTVAFTLEHVASDVQYPSPARSRRLRRVCDAHADDRCAIW